MCDMLLLVMSIGRGIHWVGHWGCEVIVQITLVRPLALILGW